MTTSYEKLMLRLRALPAAGVIMGVMSGVFMATAGFITKLVPDVHPVQLVVGR